MKKIFIYLLLFSALWNTGCEGVLEVEPENSVTYTNYFKIRSGCGSDISWLRAQNKNDQNADGSNVLCCYGTLWSGTVGRCV